MAPAVLLLSQATANSRHIAKTIRKVATARMAGLICSRMPAHIWRGMVRCSTPARKSTTTTSSNEVAKANSASPGAILRRPGLRPRLRAAGLALPLMAFVGVTFVAPLASMLAHSFYDSVVADALPETLALLEAWDGETAPGEAVFEAAARELVGAQEERIIGQVAGRVNRVQAGLRSVLAITGRRLAEGSGGPWRETMTGIDSAWGEVRTWHAVRTAGERFTTRHYLAAFDMQRQPDGSIARQDPERRIYLRLFGRTLLVSLGITGLCLVLGYPVAHLIVHSPPWRGSILLALVLVPFWTSLLVRTTSWIVLLQTQGVVNDLLVALGLVDDDGRLALVRDSVPLRPTRRPQGPLPERCSSEIPGSGGAPEDRHPRRCARGASRPPLCANILETIRSLKLVSRAEEDHR